MMGVRGGDGRMRGTKKKEGWVIGKDNRRTGKRERMEKEKVKKNY